MNLCRGGNGILGRIVRLTASGCTFWLTACQLWNGWEEPSVHTYPSEANTVVTASTSLSVSFPFPVEPVSAEGIFKIQDGGGAVPGALSWMENTLFFKPEPDLKPGQRYVLSLDGTFYDRKGKPHEIHRVVPFFYGHFTDSAPRIEQVMPSIGQPLSPCGKIRLTFNRAMDPSTLRDGLTLSPNVSFGLNWSESNRVVELSPEKNWTDRTIYTLSFSDKVRDAQGMSLTPPSPLLFWVQEDTTRPSVVSVEAALNDGQSFPALSPELDAYLGNTDALRVTFSEPMDREKTKAACRILPQPSGNWAWLDDRVLVFVPSPGWQQGTRYTFSVDEGAEDLSGNRALPFQPLVFTPSILPLRVEVLLVEDGISRAGETCSPSRAEALTLSPPAWKDYTFRFVFRGGSFPTPAEKLDLQKGIQLSCLFPPASPSPVPIGYSWVGDNQLSVTYTGFVPSTATERYYYLLSIKGGEKGVRASGGSRLERDVEQLLMTKER